MAGVRAWAHAGLKNVTRDAARGGTEQLPQRLHPRRGSEGDGRWRALPAQNNKGLREGEALRLQWGCEEGQVVGGGGVGSIGVYKGGALRDGGGAGARQRCNKDL